VPVGRGSVGKLWENVLLVGKFSSEKAKFGDGNPTLWRNLGAKMENLSRRKLLCEKSAAVCRKIANSCPA